MKVLLNKDKDHVAMIREALKNNEGYCPCRLTKDEDSKCMCREFREQSTPGFCHCGLYEKVEEQ